MRSPRSATSPSSGAKRAQLYPFVFVFLALPVTARVEAAVRPSPEPGGAFQHPPAPPVTGDNAPIDASSAPEPARWVATVELDGEAVLFDETSGSLHLLDPVATVIGTGSTARRRSTTWPPISV